jgi:tetratricopeptide (TPR) repeat protein
MIDRVGRALAAFVVSCSLVAAPAFAAPTLVEHKIDAAQRAIDAAPGRYEPYVDLATALVRRVRETANPAFYVEANRALDRAAELAPDNADVERVRITILLGQRRFAEALERASALNRSMPDEIAGYALLVDANLALGRYDAAENAAQWMLDLRSQNNASLIHGAKVREVLGDHDGASELFEKAYQRAPVDDAEERAWLLVQLARVRLLSGRADVAAALAADALRLFPDYPFGLAGLAEARTAQGRNEDAIALWRKLCSRSPRAEHFYRLALALRDNGRTAEARSVFASFERRARAHIADADNANRELVFYYAADPRRAAEALAIARREASMREDVYTLDALAWALHANRRDADARGAIERALAVGVRDATLFYHAAAIADRQQDRRAARGFVRDAVRLAPWSADARALGKRYGMTELGAGSAPRS